MARIDDIKKLIKEQEAEWNRLTEEYEKKALEIKKNIDALKIELADIFLNNESKEAGTKSNFYTMVSVEFKEGGKTYDYVWDSIKSIAVGDTVNIDGKWGGIKGAKVVKVFKMSAADVDFAEIEYKCAYPVDE